jgi:hypothetical protein
MSIKQTQKEAVYSAITNTLAEKGIHFEEGSDVSSLISRDIRAQVNLILLEGFIAGTIELDQVYTEPQLKAYTSSVQSNWIRKDKRLNGNVTYTAKNPGSRAGSGDSSLKAMRLLLQTEGLSEEDKIEIQSEIDKRVTELNVVKAKKVTVNFEALPESLRAKFAK